MTVRPALRPTFVALAAGALATLAAGAVLWWLVDTYPGARRSLGGYVVGWGATMAGCFAFVGVRRLLRGPQFPIRGFTLAFREPAPSAVGYREVADVSVGDLLAALRDLGYEPEAAACDDAGAARGPADARAPLVGAHVVVTDPAGAGSVRIQLVAPSRAPGARRLGLVEIRADQDSAIDHLGLYALRTIDRLIGRVAASPIDSALTAEPVALVTAGLPDRPRALAR